MGVYLESFMDLELVQTRLVEIETCVASSIQLTWLGTWFDT
jgi:hypothetical protein